MNLSGNLFDYLIAFFGGLILSFSPCVYPLIPISAAYIGASVAGTRFKGLILSLIYVTGVAVTYSILGLIASLSGRIFGTVSANPITRILVGAVTIVFGMSMLDWFQISLPNIIKLPALKKGNYLSTFLLGLSSGLIVAPCTTPVLGAILVYLTTKKNMIYGATLLFSFAFGMGSILILVGTFSSILVNLPKSGAWMVYIKRLGAAILIGMGIYFMIVAIKGL